MVIAGGVLLAAWLLHPGRRRSRSGQDRLRSGGTHGWLHLLGHRADRRATRGVELGGGHQSVRWGLTGRGARRRAGQARDGAVPDLVDLFAIAASAGLAPASCLIHVAPRAPDPLVSPMGAAAGALLAGAPFRQVLEVLGDSLGSRGRPLLDVLADAASRGTPLAPALASVAREARDVQRRTAQERARRLPVVLLFPLVLCTLPAAVLLTVVPVVVVAVRSLAIGA
jgi:tight adherence protein C